MDTIFENIQGVFTFLFRVIFLYVRYNKGDSVKGVHNLGNIIISEDFYSLNGAVDSLSCGSPHLAVQPPSGKRKAIRRSNLCFFSVPFSELNSFKLA